MTWRPRADFAHRRGNATRARADASAENAGRRSTRLELERVVSGVLRLGVIVSSVVVVVGTTLSLADPSTRESESRVARELRRGVLHPAAMPAPHTWSSVISAVAKGNGPGLVMLGLLLLILTPVMRVAVSVVGFALERDRRFVFVTVTVLFVLIGAFALGA